MKTPSSQDFFDFYIGCNTILSKQRSLLSKPITEDVEWKILEAHHTFKWLNQRAGFENAISTLKYKKLIQSDLIFPHEKLRLAYICCGAFHIYVTKLLYPNLIQVTNQSLLNKAEKPVDALLELLSEGLQIQNPNDTYKLHSLLSELKDEITGKAPTSYPKENKGYLAEKDLVVNLYDNFSQMYGDAPATAIYHIVTIIDDSMTKRQVYRYIKPYREYLEKRKEYENIKKARGRSAGLMATRQE